MEGVHDKNDKGISPEISSKNENSTAVAVENAVADFYFLSVLMVILDFFI